jgi:hypothetical protein
MRSFVTCTLPRILLGRSNQGWDGTCRRNGRVEKHKIRLVNLKIRDYSEDVGIDGRIIHLRETGWKVIDWIHLAQNIDQWRAVVNTVMNLRVP